MPTKKVAVKKVGGAKPVAKKAGKGKKDLVSAPSEQCFWTTDGRVLANLVELRDALKGMSEAVFAHHVAKGKNDFADWIEHVLQDAELAAVLRKSKKPNTAREVVVSRLRIYNI